MIRIAAVADLHVAGDVRGEIADSFAGIEEHADVLLLGGDLTTHGVAEQGAILAAELRDVPIPIVAVLGNHDHHSGDEAAVRRSLERAGIAVLEREATEIEIRGARLGIAGAKGFGGGFAGTSATEFGEEEMKGFARISHRVARDLEGLLETLSTDLRVLLLHYAPIRDTLRGEPPEIFPFLGSYRFAEAADRVGADLILHGHAHRGTEHGRTPGGIPVRNIAKPVLRQAYAVFSLDPSADRRVGTEAAAGSQP